MKTIRIKIYKFEELNEKAKQNAINNLSNINVDFDWWDSIYEDSKNIGLNITSFKLDRNRNAKGQFLLSACEVAQNIINEHGETCQSYILASTFLDAFNPLFSDYMDSESQYFESANLGNAMQNLEDDFLYNLLEYYSVMLQNESEYLQTDEAIKETIIVNEYDFLKDGKRYY